MRKGTYLWYVKPSAQARRDHAIRLRSVGIAHVQVKAGGDGNPTPWAQWSDPAATREYREEGLEVEPWFYTEPTSADRQQLLGLIAMPRD